jgi:hypothetical protein
MNYADVIVAVCSLTFFGSLYAYCCLGYARLDPLRILLTMLSLATSMLGVSYAMASANVDRDAALFIGAIVIALSVWGGHSLDNLAFDRGWPVKEIAWFPLRLISFGMSSGGAVLILANPDFWEMGSGHMGTGGTMIALFFTFLSLLFTAPGLIFAFLAIWVWSTHRKARAIERAAMAAIPVRQPMGAKAAKYDDWRLDDDIIDVTPAPEKKTRQEPNFDFNVEGKTHG